MQRLSVVRVEAPLLVIAERGHPRVQLDLRVLDRIALLSEAGDDGQRGPEQLASDRRSDVLLVCGDTHATLHIAAGPDAAERIVREARPLTRVSTGALGTRMMDSTPPGTQIRTADHGRVVLLSSKFAGDQFELSKPRMTIGRTDTNDIVIKEGSISRSHAQITREPSTGLYTVTSLPSSDGFRIYRKGNDSPICDEAVELRTGDVIDLGRVLMRFVGSGEDVVIARPLLDTPPELETFLRVGGESVVRRGGWIEIGATWFRIDDVVDYASCDANMPLEGEHQLQATLAMLVVGALERESGLIRLSGGLTDRV